MKLLREIRKVIDDMVSKNIDYGSTIYKICPKCNENHSGSCQHCAWRGTSVICDIGVHVWQDGSFNEKPLQIVPRKMLAFDIHLCELWNIQYFATFEEAMKALTEYDKIRNTPDKKQRKEAFDRWYDYRRAEYEHYDAEEVKTAVFEECANNSGYKCSRCKARVKIRDVVNETHKYCYRCGARFVGVIPYDDEFEF